MSLVFPVRHVVVSFALALAVASAPSYPQEVAPQDDVDLSAEAGLESTTPIADPTASEDPEVVFQRGYDAYANARYEQAAQAFRRLAERGLSDARIEYNLANAEFKLGRMGPAILHFERARRLDPTDAEVRDNLEYARSFLVDRVETPALPWILERATGFQNSLGPDRQAWIGVAVLWLLVGVVAWPLARPHRRHGSGSLWLAAALATLLLIVGLSWSQTFRRLEGERLGVVLAPAVEVLAGPGSNNASIDTVHEGLTVEIRVVRDEWVQVSLPNGLSGWLPRPALGQV